MNFSTLRFALMQARDALTKHVRADSGYADFEARQRAAVRVSQALVSLGVMESELEDLERDADLFDYLLRHLPPGGFPGLRPTVYLARGWKPEAAWRQAIHDAMLGESDEDSDLVD